MLKRRGTACQNDQWFTWRQTRLAENTHETPNVLLPMYDVSKVRQGVLVKISHTKRSRIPRHMELIKDLSDANTRFFLERHGENATFAVALDREAMVMLRQAGAVLQKRSYRHELTGSLGK